jgi:hypothetical protein
MWSPAAPRRQRHLPHGLGARAAGSADAAYTLVPNAAPRPRALVATLGVCAQAVHIVVAPKNAIKIAACEAASNWCSRPVCEMSRIQFGIVPTAVRALRGTR